MGYQICFILKIKNVTYAIDYTYTEIGRKLIQGQDLIRQTNIKFTLKVSKVSIDKARFVGF